MKNLYLVLVLAIFVTSLSFAQIEIDIADGMTVETTGSVYISGVSDVIENTSGYLKGKVESSSLSSATQFAGLTLGTGFTGTITRTTGTPLSTGSPKTALRNYSFATGSPITSDVTLNLVTSGANDESNGIAEKYVYTNDGAAWKGYSDNASTPSLIKAAGVDVIDGTNLTVAEGVGLVAKIYLEGPYNSTANNMNNSLYTGGNIPTTSPFTALAPRTASSVPTSAVDWVLLEIRTGTAASTTVGYRSAFVDVNGNIINDAGATEVGLPGIGGTDYYIVVKHRNHLGVMSNLPQTLPWLTL